MIGGTSGAARTDDRGDTPRAVRPDTIVAISTAEGPGLRGIVRLSGPDAHSIADRVVAPAAGSAEAETLSRRAPSVTGSSFAFASAEAPCERMDFVAPRSFTREDLVELHTFGARPLLDHLVDLCRRAGARLADPGEFTRRAFESGRIDLTQVEAVLEILRASNRDEVDRALMRYEGTFGRSVRAVREDLVGLAARIETQLDFSDQDLDIVTPQEVAAGIESVRARVRELAGAPSAGGIDSGAPTVVLIGAPNAGKSSLFNRLVGSDRALVTDVPGTTLDAIEASIDVDGEAMRLVDIAGLRSDARDTVETEAIRRVDAWAREADVVVVVVDGSRPLSADAAARIATLAIETSILVAHQSDRGTVVGDDELVRLGSHGPIVRTSAITGEGLDALRERMREALRGRNRSESSRSMPNARQRACLDEAGAALDRAVAEDGELELELVALEVRDAIRNLGAVTGDDTSESLLDRVFEDFCIGK